MPVKPGSAAKSLTASRPRERCRGQQVNVGVQPMLGDRGGHRRDVMHLTTLHPGRHGTGEPAAAAARRRHVTTTSSGSSTRRNPGLRRRAVCPACARTSCASSAAPPPAGHQWTAAWRSYPSSAPAVAPTPRSAAPARRSAQSAPRSREPARRTSTDHPTTLHPGHTSMIEVSPSQSSRHAASATPATLATPQWLRWPRMR